MNAVIYEQYGSPDVLSLREVDKPTPKENQVLIRVYAASINAADWHLLTADIFLVRLMTGGLFKPKNRTLGLDVAGRVEAVGANVKQFKPGDDVFGDVGMSGSGSLAEYTCASEDGLALKPANVSFEQAAAVPVAALTALQGLRDMGKIEQGKKVLIQGASGGVGTFAVQLAKWFGAEVTAVCSTRNVEMARSLGADQVIDYKNEDFTQNGKQYDLILAVNGYHSLAAYKRALAPNGSYVMAGGTAGQIFQAMLLGSLMSTGGGKKMGGVSANTNQKDLELLGELVQTGKVVPVIDRCYPLSEAADALRYLGEGHAHGKIVVTMEHEN